MTEQDVSDLRREVAELRREIAELRKELAAAHLPRVWPIPIPADPYPWGPWRYSTTDGTS